MCRYEPNLLCIGSNYKMSDAAIEMKQQFEYPNYNTICLDVNGISKLVCRL